MNWFIATGRLGRDPELRQTPNSEVCGFSIAIDRGPRRDALWVNCSAWGTPGQQIAKYFRKGLLISVMGELEPNTWERGGVTTKEFSLNVKEWKFVPGGKKKDEEESGGEPY